VTAQTVSRLLGRPVLVINGFIVALLVGDYRCFPRPGRGVSWRGLLDGLWWCYLFNVSVLVDVDTATRHWS
jgi:hypothetical protein